MRFVDGRILKACDNDIVLDIELGDRKFFDEHPVIKDFRDKSEGQIKQELIKYLVENKYCSGWFKFYLTDTYIRFYDLYFVKKGNFKF